MKKIYVIALLGLLPFSAKAGEWEFEVSGQAKGLYGYTDVAERFEKKDQNNHGVGIGEINTSAVYTSEDKEYGLGLYLDLMGGIDRELQNYNQGRWGQEAYAIADSPYGRILLGQTFNVAAQFHDGAPSVGALSNNSDVVDFISNPNWQRDSKETRFATLNSTYINTDGVAPKISYVSPEVYGTAIGFTYVPDAYNRRGLINKHASYSRKDGYIGALYTTQELGGLNEDASLAAARYHDNDTEFSASLKFGYGNWSLGGGWRKTYIDGQDKQDSQDSRLPYLFDNYREGEAWDIGLGYEIGPFEAALSYFESKASRTENKDKIWILSNQYQLNKYIDVYLAAAHVDFEGDSSALADNNQGWAFVSGLGINF